MKYNVYAVKDTLTRFKNIILQENEMDAIRTFSMLANDKNTIVGMNAKYYELWHLGTYDDQTGELVGNTPAFITNAVSVLTHVEQEAE